MGTATEKREYWQFISKDGASDQCYLFTDAFGRVLQLLLAIAAIFIPYIKCKIETPARPLKVWAMDVGKQCVGSLVCHCLNIAVSIVFVASAASDDDESVQSSDYYYFVEHHYQCGVDFLTYVVVFLHAVRLFAVEFRLQDLVDSGYYGEPPSWRIWWMQLSAYMVVLLLLKLVDFVFVWCLYRLLVSASNAVFAEFSHHRHFELLLAMVILPGVFNSFQVWILDSQLKSTGEHWKYYSQPGTRDEKNRMYQSSQPSTNPPILFNASGLSVSGADQMCERTEPNLAIPL